MSFGSLDLHSLTRRRLNGIEISIINLGRPSHDYEGNPYTYIHKTVVLHYNDVIMSAMASQISSLTTVYATVYSGADQRKHQSSASLAFVRRINRSPVNSPHKGPVTRKMFSFDDVIMDHAVLY